MRKRIVIKDGRSDNLYKVEKIAGRYVAHHVRICGLADRENRVGAANCFEDAVALVRSHAGTTNIEIKPW